MTYREIARALDVEHYTTVYTAVRRQAKRNGHAWPLVRKRRRQLNDNTVPAEGVALEIKYFCDTRGWTIKQFANELGVHSGWIYNITSPKRFRRRVKKTSAQRIMKFITDHEKQEAAA